eukprot:TRINITY_DN9624_c0_g1_i3.p1 TRINITY_DN9624_c0_g1~~TRINITY_DN9624_c0_g1_i3.p1  ORF type:complete len:176 (+),score=43.64 TRINITY_DN9624_c0_g1_i3:399-926(+)
MSTLGFKASKIRSVLFANRLDYKATLNTLIEQSHEEEKQGSYSTDDIYEMKYAQRLLKEKNREAFSALETKGLLNEFDKGYLATVSIIKASKEKIPQWMALEMLHDYVQDFSMKCLGQENKMRALQRVDYERINRICEMGFERETVKSLYISMGRDEAATVNAAMENNRARAVFE